MMNDHTRIPDPETVPSNQSEQPEPAAARASTASVVAIVCGIAACLLSVFVVTIPLGFIFAVIALICALWAGSAARGRKAALTLVSTAALILAVYTASVLVALWADPTARLFGG